MKNWTQIASAALIASIPLGLMAANGQQATTSAGAKPKATVTQAASKTYPYHMKIVWITYAQPREWVIVIESSGFKSVDDLKKGVSTLPADSILEFEAGGRRSPGEPLLSSEKDLADFTKFCKSKNVKLVLTGK